MNEPRVPGPASGGILVMRVWTEAGRPDGFRARLTFGDGDDPSESGSAVYADRDDALEAIRAWLSTVAPPSAGAASATE